ncbi:tRNA (Cytosine(34)-C(5))-methyltransferase [Fasciola hepatica]|uniref:tRNA (Cytosine(34)-C(5))-methyltransferase n=1 Tax=Fasciola hepatica TaxID=6192 RepID=A0A2H1BSW0_FASHE|nr:tRNA (Cytosine(34)-C(5))-methyltransferase [Fasciola hepatica]
MVNRRRPRCGRHQFTAENRRNDLFEKYYKGQNIIPDDEWDSFMQALGQDLPITFRITGFRGQSKDLLRYIKESYKADIAKMPFPVDADGKQKPVSFEPLSWYPDEMAWQLDTDKYVVRKAPELKALHQFLVSEMESGKISRQEAVSMLPPLLLDIKAYHTILDLCAAPGSKSAQIVEMLHADAERDCTTDTDQDVYREPSGLLIANDLDQKRCYMMVHQIKRLQSPCAIITQEDATCFPRLYSSLFSKSEVRLKVL